MGLDVYLHYCDNYQLKEKLEKEYEERSGALWGSDADYAKMTEEDKERVRGEYKTIAQELGLGEYGQYLGERYIEEIDPRHLDHYFKIGYWRSNYNNGGFNSVMSRYNLPTLYDIVPEGNLDIHDVFPDWSAALTRAQQAARGFDELLVGDEADIDVIKVPLVNPFARNAEYAMDEGEAKAQYFEKARSHKEDGFGNSFSALQGNFFLDGLDVRAIIKGHEDSLFTKEKQPCVFVVYKGHDKDGKGGLLWYRQALDIVIATLEYVLKQSDKEKYYLGWSG